MLSNPSLLDSVTITNIMIVQGKRIKCNGIEHKIKIHSRLLNALSL